MDLNTISTIFANLGVPVACLAVTFYLWYQEMQSHKEEVNKLQDALNNNTLVLQKLLDRMVEEGAHSTYQQKLSQKQRNTQKVICFIPTQMCTGK